MNSVLRFQRCLSFLFAALLLQTAFISAAVAKTQTAAKGGTRVLLDTTKGPITIVLYEQDAPITSKNFIDLVKRGFYNGTTFHRYEPGFVIQGGDPTGTGTGNFRDPQTKKDRLIPLEKKANLKHDKAGMVAMARTNDPNSASCQFYITLAPADFLDNPPGYAVFGEVVEGLPNALKLRKGDKMKKVSLK